VNALASVELNFCVSRSEQLLLERDDRVDCDVTALIDRRRCEFLKNRVNVAFNQLPGRYLGHLSPEAEVDRHILQVVVEVPAPESHHPVVVVETS